MESYILIALCLGAWGVTVALFKFLLMPFNDSAFIVGSLAGLVMAAAAGGAYYQYLSTPSF